MKWSTLVKRLRYYLQYFPFTLNAFMLGIALWICFKIIKPADVVKGEELSSFSPLILLIGKTALWFIVALIGFSIITTFLCWLYFLWHRSKNNYQLEFNFKPSDQTKGLWLETLVKKARRPFLGFIKGRLFYDGYKMTDKFILASNKKSAGKFWREGVAGKSVLELPDIKEYAIEGGFIYFEDMLQLCSIPVRQKVKGHFYQAPEKVSLEEKESLPRKTEQTDVRIDQLRKVEGEYLNYKDFESGDDVRRVVWKVYAKNRELVVRTPEIFDPYASHIYFYASFHSESKQNTNDFSSEMLNYYKNRVWSIFEVLSKKEFEVKYIPDQTLTIPEQSNINEYVSRVISNSYWHNDKSLDEYFEPRYGSVLCISSFNNPDEVKDMLERCSGDIVVYYVKLSNTFKSFLPWAWFKRIFFLAPDDRLKRIRNRWLLTPQRFQLIKREKEIENILSKADVITAKL
jgi:hypothetical protein